MFEDILLHIDYNVVRGNKFFILVREKKVLYQEKEYAGRA
jgi:hypothetical protein